MDDSLISGIKLAACDAGIKANDRADLAIIAIEKGIVSAVFTQNRFCAAPVTVAREHLAKGAPRALIINSGNANAGTGAQGIADAEAMCAATAHELNIESHQVLPFSTGVIGEPLPISKITSAIPALCNLLDHKNWSAVSRAIMTTDTVPKQVARSGSVGNDKFQIVGIAKGSGMIHPDMATMLAYIATDLNLSQEALDRALADSVAQSFNSISVDGDTSTNDACVLISTQSVGPKINVDDPPFQEFMRVLNQVSMGLAHMIVRDGEGATKFIEIGMREGHSVEECRDVGFTVAHSPLVKTALFASDPNWGRILAAVGRAPSLKDLDVERVSIYLDDVCIVRNGSRDKDYREEMGQAVMQQSEISIRIMLGRGDAAATVWTSDLSHEYVRINAEYRT